MYKVTHRDGTVVYWDHWSAARSHAEYWGVKPEDIERVVL